MSPVPWLSRYRLPGWLLVSLVLGASCQAGGLPARLGGAGAPDDFLGFVEHKNDTAYIGNRAAEVEAEFRSRVRIDLAGRSEAELQTIASELVAGTARWNYATVVALATEQLKYARTALKAFRYDLNLESSTPAFSNVTVLPDALEFDYVVTVESLVRYSELAARGLTPADLVGQRIEATLPLSPATVFAQGGTSCATDFEAGTGAPPAEVHAENLFYYFDPARPGCALGAQDLVVASYRVQSTAQSPTAYPEYDQLVADGRVTFAAVFGQMDHGVLQQDDWGYNTYATFVYALVAKGFVITDEFTSAGTQTGLHLQRIYPTGLVVDVDALAPIVVSEQVEQVAANELFRSQMRTHELVYYNGHSGYGSLRWLEDPAGYPRDTYQIIFMDSCWSYSYYTKEIFKQKATADDPLGHRWVDVVNNTEKAGLTSIDSAVPMWLNILDAGSAVYAGASVPDYSWNNLIAHMNFLAVERNPQTPEIYGVSGARSNMFAGGGGTTEPGGPQTFNVESGAPIVDGDMYVGTTSILTLPPDAAHVRGAAVTVVIDHPAPEELTVTLEHANRSAVLHQDQPGPQPLVLTVTSAGFDETLRGGDWTLRVRDARAGNAGTLIRWSLTL